MIVTSSEKAARLYLEALADEGVAASIEVYHHTNAWDPIEDVAILVIPLNGYDQDWHTLVVEFTEQLLMEGYIPPIQRVSTRAGKQVPTGNTGPNRK